MNRASIFFKINLLFSVALIATLMAFGFLFHRQMQHNRVQNIFKGKLLLKEFRENKTISQETLKLLNASLIKGLKKREILKGGVRIIRPIFRHRGAHKKLLLIRYKEKLYYLIKAHDKRYLVTFNENSEYPWLTVVIFSAIILFLILLYWLIRKSLTPLKSLEKDISNYTKGFDLEPKYIAADDEVAKINNTFYDYATKATTLAKSRELFIRNIFHELNTPVTKGKILAEITKEQKTKQMLESIFGRLDTLLKELYNTEQITSKSYKLQRADIPIVELIDSAKELLFLDAVEHNIGSEKLNCDYKSMVIVFKNLIDNGMKYGKNFKIEYKDGAICFSSEGEQLSHPIEHYTQPFISEKRSFGMGLYIAKEILIMHKLQLKYSYSNGKNRFCIVE